MKSESNTVDGICYTYYSNYDINKKPRFGVHYIMLDEYIEIKIKKEKDKFKSELSKLFKEFNATFDEQFNKIKKDIDSLSNITKHTNKLLYKTIELNNLYKPEIKIEPSKKIPVKANKKTDSKTDDNLVVEEDVDVEL